MTISKISHKEISQVKQVTKDFSKWWATIGIGIGVFMFALDVYIVNLALPVMVESLHTSFTTIQWVVLSYLLAIAIFVLSAAKLGDMWSKKPLYITGLMVFTVSSLLCGLAPNVSFLIAFRALQGLGAAFISGLGTAMIVEAFPEEERGLGLGIRAAVFGLGIMLGPTIGGLLISVWEWPLIFLINVPVGMIGCLIVAYLVPGNKTDITKQSFDIVGTVILTLSLTCFTLAISLWQNQGLNPHTPLTLLTLSLLGFGCFLIVEAKLPQPMVDLSIFQSLEFSLGLGLRFLGNFVMAGAIFILPFFLKLVKQYPTEQAGLLLAIPPILIVLTAPIAGSLADRYGSRIISLMGLLLMAIGCLLLSTFDTHLNITSYVFDIVPYGIGVGMFQSPNNSTIMGAAPKNSLGIASGLLSLSRILGQTVGVPLVGAIFSFVTLTKANLNSSIDVTNAPIASLVFGTHITFLFASALLFTSTIFAVGLWWWENKNSQVYPNM